MAVAIETGEDHMQKYKKIVYLDQNFVSNLAKALYLSGWKDSQTGFYRELHDLLSNLTKVVYHHARPVKPGCK